MKILVSISSLILCLSLQGQQTIYDEATVLYKKEFKAGLKLHGHGWGVVASLGYQKAVNEIVNLNLSIVGMKNPNEDKRFDLRDERAKPFVFGKQNHLYLIRPTFGKRKVLAYKERKTGVEFSYNWAIGPTFGITKPYYLIIRTPLNSEFDLLTEEAYDPIEHTSARIFGRGNWFNGFGDLNAYIGAYGKFSFSVEYAGDQTKIQGFEAGISLDAFPNEIPVLAEEIPNTGVIDKNKNLYFNFFANIFIGKKYN